MQQTGYIHPPADPDVAASVRDATHGLGMLANQLGGLQDLQDRANALGTVEQVPEEQREALYETARGLCESGDFHNALPLAMQLTTLDPGDARFPFIAAACLQQLGHPELAVSMYAAAALAGREDIAASPRVEECMRNMASAPDDTQAFELREELAAGVCAMALAVPQDARIAFRMGECLREMQQHEAAIQAFEACVEAARANAGQRHLQAAAETNLHALRAPARR